VKLWIALSWSGYTNPKVLVLMAVRSLFRSMALLESIGKYNLAIQVFAVVDRRLGSVWTSSSTT